MTEPESATILQLFSQGSFEAAFNLVERHARECDDCEWLPRGWWRLCPRGHELNLRAYLAIVRDENPKPRRSPADSRRRRSS